MNNRRDFIEIFPIHNRTGYQVIQTDTGYSVEVYDRKDNSAVVVKTFDVHNRLAAISFAQTRSI